MKIASLSSCFVCNKAIPKDSSKRRMHIGKHVLKAMRNVPEAAIPKDSVSCPTILSYCSVRAKVFADSAISLWDMWQIDVARELCRDIDLSSWWHIQNFFYLPRFLRHYICFCPQRIENDAVYKYSSRLRTLRSAQQLQYDPWHLAI
jgi:hypothetical protein